MNSTESLATIKVQVPFESKEDFIDWQTKLNRIIAGFPGFISLEILAMRAFPQQEWMINQRFQNAQDVVNWKRSDEYQKLIQELQKILGGRQSIQETESGTSHLREGVTEIIVTQVNPEKENEYRQWIAKIHRIEASFPGFLGTYVQSPRKGQGKNWITLLHFDTPENLDRWLSSSQRTEVLNESTNLITALETHRVVTPYAGWFSSLAEKGEIPSVWKQTMLVLLVLFPIVMLELKFLSPSTAPLNRSLATFISNAISVSLIAWPMMPIAIWFLSWWLVPKYTNKSWITVLGVIVVLLLYLLEIAVFWNFL